MTQLAASRKLQRKLKSEYLRMLLTFFLSRNMKSISAYIAPHTPSVNINPAEPSAANVAMNDL